MQISKKHKKNIPANIKKFFSNPEKETFLPYLILLTYLVIGSIILHDYGISMDEPIQRKHGIVSFDYVNERFNLFPDIPKTTDEDLQQYDHRDYGVIFQMFCYLIERKLNINNTRDIFVLRHIITFLLFWVAVYFFYKVVFLHFSDWRLATLGIVFFILSPRIFVEAFYNPKDIVLLSWMTIGYYTLIRFLRETTIKFGILHGLITALAINARIVALILPTVTIIFLVVIIIFNHKDWKSIIYAGVPYLAVSLVFTILFWPFLWEKPFQNLLYVFYCMKQFRWDGLLLYWGGFVSASNLPWHYTLSWILVSTPIFYTILFAIGIIVIIGVLVKLIRKKVVFVKKDIEKYAFAILFLFPLSSVIIFHSVLYHGWRHMFFIYPGFICISLIGLQYVFYIMRKLKYGKLLKKGFAVIILAVFLFVTFEMYTYHPYQYVYFNWLLGKKPLDKFDGDYYGLSFYPALTHLVMSKNSPNCKVKVSSMSGIINRMNFGKEIKNIVITNSIDSADYYISNLCSPADYWISYLSKTHNSQYNSLLIISDHYFRKSRIYAIYKL